MHPRFETLLLVSWQMLLSPDAPSIQVVSLRVDGSKSVLRVQQICFSLLGASLLASTILPFWITLQVLVKVSY